jgi:hypothetical protein
LPHAIGNFKKSVMCIELGMAPQAWVYSFRRRPASADEVIPIYISHHASGCIGNAAGGERSNEASLGPIKVAGI